MTTLPLNAAAETVSPPFATMSLFSASRLAELTRRIGLSFERRIRPCFCCSESESGGDGGPGKEPGNEEEEGRDDLRCLRVPGLEWRILGPWPPGGKRASTQGTFKISEKKAFIEGMV